MIILPDFNTGTGLEAVTEETRMPPAATLQTWQSWHTQLPNNNKNSERSFSSGLKINDLSVYWFPTLAALFHSVHKAKVVLQAVWAVLWQQAGGACAERTWRINMTSGMLRAASLSVGSALGMWRSWTSRKASGHCLRQGKSTKVGFKHNCVSQGWPPTVSTPISVCRRHCISYHSRLARKDQHIRA